MWAFPGRLAVDLHPAASIPGTPCPVLPLRPNICTHSWQTVPFSSSVPKGACTVSRIIYPSSTCLRRGVATESKSVLTRTGRAVQGFAAPPSTVCGGACLICQCQDLDKVRLIYTRSLEELNVPNSRGSMNGVRRTVTDISWTSRDSVTSEGQGACGSVFFLLSGMHSIYKFRSII